MAGYQARVWIATFIIIRFLASVALPLYWRSSSALVSLVL
jgi:hypothetical protein